MRVGIGYDIHALKKGRRLVLGGVDIPFSKGLVGHSDGDVLFHAIVDAVLGALGEEDIGTYFPPSDPRLRGANSLMFVSLVKKILKKRGLKILHVDSTLVAEAPKLTDYKHSIRDSIAEGLGLKRSQVGLKAKTNEGFGAIGQNKAIACFSIVSLGKE